MMETREEITFESAVEQLESIVTAMETGSLPLDECLRQFERAVSLSRQCAAQLEAAEKQIAVLTADGLLEPVRDDSWRSSGAGRTVDEDPFAG
jgi:exodeoxyribonuclease VII small subunit